MFYLVYTCSHPSSVHAQFLLCFESINTLQKRNYSLLNLNSERQIWKPGASDSLLSLCPNNSTIFKCNLNTTLVVMLLLSSVEWKTHHIHYVTHAFFSLF